MSTFCTIADLTKKLDEADLIGLAADESNTTLLLADSDVQARLSYYIADGSNKVRRRLAAKFPDLDSDVAADAVLAADLRDVVVAWVLFELFTRQRHYGSANPYSEAWKEAKEELDRIAEGKIRAGAENAPDNLVQASLLDDVAPTYSRDVNASTGTRSLSDSWGSGR